MWTDESTDSNSNVNNLGQTVELAMAKKTKRDINFQLVDVVSKDSMRPFRRPRG